MATMNCFYKDGVTTSTTDRNGDVGTVASISRSGRAQVVGGSTGALITVEQRNMREEEPKKSLERFIIKYTGDSSRTQFPLQTDAAEVAAVGWSKAGKGVVDNGDELTRGRKR